MLFRFHRIGCCNTIVVRHTAIHVTFSSSGIYVVRYFYLVVDIRLGTEYSRHMSAYRNGGTFSFQCIHVQGLFGTRG